MQRTAVDGILAGLDRAFGGAILSEPAWVTCPRCEARVVAVDGPHCYECEQQDERARMHAAAVRRSGLRAEHAWATTDNEACARMLGFPSAGVLRGRVSALLEPRSVCPVLTLTGDTGAGKTTLAVLVAKARLSSCLFVTSHELAEAVGQHALGRGGAELVERAKRVRVLVIDELRLPALSSAKDAIENLVWGRIGDGLLTVITHGFPEQVIKRDWGAGMHRRMYADGKHVHLGGR